MPHISIFWVHGGNRTKFEQGYRKLAKLAGLPRHDDISHNIQPDVKAWLEGPDSGEWILVLDNADDKSHFICEDVEPDGSTSTTLTDYLPDGYKGTVLVTTRDYEVAQELGGKTSTTKDQMTESEVEQLFQQYYRCAPGEDMEPVKQLLQALQYLPLAIVQAARYLDINRTVSVPTYLDLFNSTRADQMKLLQKAKSSTRHGRASNAETILSTFTITFRHVQQQSPLAASLLKFIGCIDHRGIPHELLVSSGTKDDEVEIEVSEAISKLINFSLLRKNQVSEQTYDMHALVHVSIEAYLSLDEMQACAYHAAEVLRHRLPDPEFKNWPVWMIYFPHAIAIANRHVESVAAGSICLLMAMYLESLGRYDEAEKQALRANHLLSNFLGEDDLINVTCIGTLGSIYSKQGRLQDAEKLLLHVMAPLINALGKYHPHTLDRLGNLAFAILNQGRQQEAEDLLVKVLDIEKITSGPENRETWNIISTLANIYLFQGRLQEAEELLVQLVEAETKVLGLEHPYTLTAKIILAQAYTGQDKLIEAEALLVQVINIGEKVLGFEDPDILCATGLLGEVYTFADRLQEAEKLLLQLLQRMEKVLGQGNPKTVHTMGLLADTYQRQGRLKESGDLLMQMIDIGLTEKLTKVFGEENRNTVDSMANLAQVYEEQGLQSESEKLHLKMVDISTRLWGMEHRDTLTAMENLGRFYMHQDRLLEAERLMLQVVGKLTKEQIDTLDTIAILVLMTQQQGQLEDAKELLLQAVEAGKRLLGPDHPKTLFMNELLEGMYRES